MPGIDTSLGATIRLWRDRLNPAAVGLVPRAGRRAAGLRREELAGLAGLSVDYLVRLEQGRAVRPSPPVVASLARALQLSDAERDHLYALAGLRAPDDGLITDHLPPGMQRMLRRLGDTPVGVFAADWRLLWWNRSWSALLGDPSGVPIEERNLVRARFPDAGTARLLSQYPVLAHDADLTDRAVVADLRRATGRYPADARLAALIARTQQGNDRFRRLWQEAPVATHREDRKIIRHPHAGDITVDCDVLTDGDTDMKIVVYTVEPGSEDEARLDFARVIGTQTSPV